uniref:Uncharacterized protein n=1 Tax=Chromera velia CCMP2878 TaxID=1169474 RepID=A0A0G4I4K7_9ALVE|eukprot:Cvel_1810.t1-p1 / transcript=Cvel_1810.t1 / gene=Cvel_1810 / organism=Chromera_velia_CCMP2878 / gene_product=Condensin-2 complex subunit G2, putative / transcript_product=Condensin-2 complex subunit G2, putative / location=Cvel_scaffold66:135447-148531(+) / protein_length=1297 / sequence_SO=supercontig / SO=protein_coding / is_pseudo=false
MASPESPERAPSEADKKEENQVDVLEDLTDRLRSIVDQGVRLRKVDLSKLWTTETKKKMEALDFNDHSADPVKQEAAQIFKMVHNATHLLKLEPEGPALLSVLLLKDSSLVRVIGEGVELLAMQSPSEEDFLMFSDLFYKTWKESGSKNASPLTTMEIERLLKRIVKCAILTRNEKAAKNLRTCLATFRLNAGALRGEAEKHKLKRLLFDTHNAFLWQHLSRANWTVRMNACQVLAYVFPLTNPERNMEALNFDEQVLEMIKCAEDPEEPVRKAALHGLIEWLQCNYGVLKDLGGGVTPILKFLFEKAIRDKNSVDMRVETLKGLAVIVNNPVMFGVKLQDDMRNCPLVDLQEEGGEGAGTSPSRGFLPSVVKFCMNDPESKVQEALIDLLEALRIHCEGKASENIWEYVEMASLMGRLDYEFFTATAIDRTDKSFGDRGGAWRRKAKFCAHALFRYGQKASEIVATVNSYVPRYPCALVAMSTFADEWAAPAELQEAMLQLLSQAGERVYQLKMAGTNAEGQGDEDNSNTENAGSSGNANGGGDKTKTDRKRGRDGQAAGGAAGAKSKKSKKGTGAGSSAEGSVAEYERLLRCAAVQLQVVVRFANCLREEKVKAESAGKGRGKKAKGKEAEEQKKANEEILERWDEMMTTIKTKMQPFIGAILSSPLAAHAVDVIRHLGIQVHDCSGVKESLEFVFSQPLGTEEEDAEGGSSSRGSKKEDPKKTKREIGDGAKVATLRAQTDADIVVNHFAVGLLAADTGLLECIPVEAAAAIGELTRRVKEWTGIGGKPKKAGGKKVEVEAKGKTEEQLLETVSQLMCFFWERSDDSSETCRQATECAPLRIAVAEFLLFLHAALFESASGRGLFRECSSSNRGSNPPNASKASRAGKKKAKGGDGEGEGDEKSRRSALRVISALLPSILRSALHIEKDRSSGWITECLPDITFTSSPELPRSLPSVLARLLSFLGTADPQKLMGNSTEAAEEGNAKTRRGGERKRTKVKEEEEAEEGSEEGGLESKESALISIVNIYFCVAESCKILPFLELSEDSDEADEEEDEDGESGRGGRKNEQREKETSEDTHRRNALLALSGAVETGLQWTLKIPGGEGKCAFRLLWALLKDLSVCLQVIHVPEDAFFSCLEVAVSSGKPKIVGEQQVRSVVDRFVTLCKGQKGKVDKKRLQTKLAETLREAEERTQKGGENDEAHIELVTSIKEQTLEKLRTGGRRRKRKGHGGDAGDEEEGEGGEEGYGGSEEEEGEDFEGAMEEVDPAQMSMQDLQEFLTGTGTGGVIEMTQGV